MQHRGLWIKREISESLAEARTMSGTTQCDSRIKVIKFGLCIGNPNPIQESLPQ